MKVLIYYHYIFLTILVDLYFKAILFGEAVHHALMIFFLLNTRLNLILCRLLFRN